MTRMYRHPVVEVERILEELANQGVDLKLIDEFARRAAERSKKRQSVGNLPTSGEQSTGKHRDTGTSRRHETMASTADALLGRPRKSNSTVKG